MQFGIRSRVCARGVRTSVRSSLAVTVLSTLVVLLSSDVASAQQLSNGWTAWNVGSPPIAGVATETPPTWCVNPTAACVGFSVAAGGADIWDANDQFVFVARVLQGDGSIVARVGGLQHTDPWAKAGLMLRESLAGNARHASIFVTPTQGVAFQRRSETGGLTSHTAGSSGTTPRWLKLQRSGSTVTAFESADGWSWTFVGSDILSTGSALYVGIAVTSHNAATLTGATVTDVAVATALPDEWSFTNVGAPALSGSAVSTGSGVRVAGAGADVWDAADQLAYVYRPIIGDADIIARISDLDAKHPWTKAGLMVRGSLASDAPHAFAMVTGANGLSFQGRVQTGAFSQQFNAIGGAAPAWLKIERRGMVVNAYTSVNGTQWSLLGSAVIALTNAAYIGLAVTSHDDWQMASAGFDGITVRDLSVAGNLLPSVTMTSPATGGSFTAPATVTLSAAAADADGSITSVEFHSGQTFLGAVTAAPYTAQWSGLTAGTYSVTATAFDNRGDSSVSTPITFTVSRGTEGSLTLPTEWTASDIGGPALTGSASYASGSFVVQASGADVWGSADQLGFVYRQVTGDVDIVMRVAGLQAPDAWTKAGVMMRGSLSSDAAYAFAMVTGSSGIAYQGRPQTGAAAEHFGETPGGAPAWLKLQRRRNVITAFASGDGFQWGRLGAATIALPASAYIGIAVTSHSVWQPASAVFGDVNVSSVIESATLPPITVPPTTVPPVTVPPPSVPTKVVFTPSMDHDTLVQRYVLDVFAGSLSGAVVATQDLGKPVAVNGEITADIAATLQALPSGSYVATVTAVGAGGVGASEAVAFAK